MNELFSEPEPEFDPVNNNEYKVKAIKNTTVYVKETEKSTKKSSSAVMHLWKIISIFHKNYPEKPMTISPPFDSAPPIAKLSVKPIKLYIKQKRDHPTGSTK